MPKRWKITRGGSWTWVFEEYGNGTSKVIARADMSWDSKQKVRDEIDDMRRTDEIEEEPD